MDPYAGYRTEVAVGDRATSGTLGPRGRCGQLSEGRWLPKRSKKRPDPVRSACYLRS